jgi:CubicO group peptidase (beta-lactamase class C family)
MAGHVEAGEMPGLVMLAARGDEVHIEAIGSPSFTDHTPLAQSALFRIASLTKPIVAVAALSLVEEGVLDLERPVDDLLPELSDRRVLRSLESELDEPSPPAARSRSRISSASGLDLDRSWRRLGPTRSRSPKPSST